MTLINTSEDIISALTASSQKKAAQPFHKLLIAGILAGAAIAFGACAGAVAMHGISDVGVGRMAAGCVFPVGLMLVIMLGAELFTGDCLMFIGVIYKKITPWYIVRTLVLVFLANLVGGILIALLVANSGQFDYSSGMLGAFTIKTAVAKTQLPFGTALVSGILCNIIVCFTVLLANKATTVSGKIFAVFFPIFLFVICGFEHCVANMYYISAGVFASMNPHYTQLCMDTYGITQEAIQNLNWQSFFLNNLLPVTIGNILGGIATCLTFLGIIDKVRN